MPVRGLSSQRGFTLIEVMMAMLILAVGIGGAIALIDGANARTLANKHREAANALAREVIEDAHSVPYRRLTPAGAATELKAMPGLADSTPSTLAWTVERVNQTYTLSVSVCSVDDDQDGYGDHTGGGFCAAGGATDDPNPDDYKRIVVDVTWNDGSIARSAKQAALVNNESSASGPGVEITSQVPAGDLITQDVSSIAFNVQAEDGAVAIRFAVDGVVLDTKANSTTASFAWDIDTGSTHVPDGTYIVSVTAFDAEGTPGVTRSRTIRLNRDEPAAPKDVLGGWNALFGIVDLQWSRNNEPDVIGYRVYRRAPSGSWTLVPSCDLATNARATDCSDVDPPAGATVEYRVVALDEDPFSGQAREGTPSSIVTATRSTTQPNGPASVTAAADGDDILLSWPDAPPVVPAYAGSSVIFYRVYRDGTSLGDRIGRTGQEFLTSFRDNDAASGNHQYWVTAVDQNFSESTPVGPVSLP